MVPTFWLMLLALKASFNECVVNTQTSQTEPSTQDPTVYAVFAFRLTSSPEFLAMSELAPCTAALDDMQRNSNRTAASVQTS
jgi:hypothetical protein